MDDLYISRYEHEEFALRVDANIKRLEEEDDRQNHRVDEISASVRELQKLAVSVESLAISLNNMCSEQKKQGERLEKLEDAPVKQWTSLKQTIINGIVGAVIAFLIAGTIWAAVQAFH